MYIAHVCTLKNFTLSIYVFCNEQECPVTQGTSFRSILQLQLKSYISVYSLQHILSCHVLLSWVHKVVHKLLLNGKLTVIL